MDFRTKGIGHFNQILKSKNAMDNWTFGQKELDNSATAESLKPCKLNAIGHSDKRNWTFQPNAEIKKAMMDNGRLKMRNLIQADSQKLKAS